MATVVTKTIRASGGDYSLLSSWEAAIPADLVTADEQWIAECYNDWASGLSDIVIIVSRITDATRNIIVRAASADGTQGASRHNGVPKTGFYATYSANYTDIISVQNGTDVVIDGIECDHTSLGSGISAGDQTTIRNCIGRNGAGTTGRAGFCFTTGSIIESCLAHDSVRGFGNDNSFKSPELYNCTAINCSVHGFNLYGTVSSPLKINNCVAYSCAVDFNNINAIDASSSNNATSATTIDSSLGTIVDIASTDFVDAANDNYNLSPDSQLLNAGKELSSLFTTDIRGKSIPKSGTTYYWPIGAFYGPDFRAIRETTAWGLMTAAEKSKYNDTYYSLLSTWEAALPSDLTVNNEICVAECFNDWPSGLADFISLLGHTTSTENKIYIRTPQSERHDGIDITSGFHLSRTNTYFNYITLSITNSVVDGIAVNHTSTANGVTAVHLSTNSIVKNCMARVGLGASTPVCFESIGDNSVVYNCIALDSQNGFIATNYDTGEIYNNIAADCQDGFSLTNNGSGCTVKNNVAYNCTNDYLDTGSVNAASSNNATSEATTSHAFVSVTGIASTDFADAANDDFHLSASSNLIGAGVNLDTIFTDDVDGDARPASPTAWDIGFDHYVGGAGPVEVSVAFATSLTQAALSAATAEASYSVGASLNQANLADATGEAIVTNGISAGFSTGAIISIEASVTEALSVSASNSANATTEGSVTNQISTTFGVSSDAIAEANAAAGVSSGFTTSATVTAGGAISADVQFDISVASIKTADAIAEANLSVGSQLGMQASADVIANASIASGISLDSILTAGTIIESTVTFGSNAGMSVVGEALSGAYILADITSDVSAGAAANANATAEASIQASAQIACAIIAEAAAQAGLNVGQITNVVVDGNVVTGGIVTIPDGRVLTVSAEVRILTVDPENREIIVQ